MQRNKFIINFELAPGDITVSTALVRDLKLTYGDQVSIDFRTNFPSIFHVNPHLTRIPDNDPDAVRVDLDYSQGILSSRDGNQHHFLTWFHRDFMQKTGVSVPPIHAKPDLHLTQYEKNTRPISGRYWLMFAGGKRDIVTKYWDFEKYQEVADTLRDRGVRVVQSGSRRIGHFHPPMKNVTSVVGWGGVRELIWQIYHAEGVICPVTCAMHMAAAFDKPCVVIAGGREEPWWEAYTNEYQAFGPAASVVIEHKFLHTLGKLDCCEKAGCWLQQVVFDGDVPKNCQNIVKRPADMQQLPACMDMITVDDVVNGVMDYYEVGALPALDSNPEEPELVVPRPKQQARTRKVIGDVYIPS
jgi:hypothetical protein